ncbi:MAG: SPOR domain-containing protein [Bacteroidota bacterium]
MIHKWIAVFLLLAGGIFSSQAQQGTCIAEEELALANQLNQFRKQNDLNVLPVSTALSYVADVHVKDLYLHYDPFGDCNLLSWSDSGRWQECCVSGEDYVCMHSKPDELTQYKGKGYELVYYQNTQVTSGLAFNGWKENASAKSMILQQGKYEDKKWQVIGVALFDGYASVWFGEEPDGEGEPPLCSELEQVSQKQEEDAGESKQENINVPEYYIIVASHRQEDDALEEQERLSDKFNAIVLQSGTNFRVALGPFKGYSKAQKQKESVADQYPKSWILKSEPNR